MKVLVTGATGYIGSAVADALQAAGHEVVGLARNDAAERKLAGRGVAAIRGDLADSASVERAARSADAVIHTATTNDGAVDASAVEATLRALEGSGKPYIYTSGIWVHGDTAGRTVDETTPLAPISIVKWRVGVEDEVLAAADRGVRAVVIRPGVVYGRGAGIPAMLVAEARESGAARTMGSGDNHWTVVNVDDLADLYLRALERAPAGTVLIAVAGPSVRYADIARAASEGAGKQGATRVWPLDDARAAVGPFADALAIDQHASGARAESLLGWKPSRPGILEDLSRGSYAA